MKISENGLNLIKRFEGCRLSAYQDSVGVWTIGYGTTNADKAITGTTICQGLKISQATADDWLRQSVDKKYGPKVDKYSAYNWNQNEYDAVVSFAYNIGSIDGLTAKGARTRAELAAKTGWQQENGGWRFYKDDGSGEYVSDKWQQDGDKWYWFDGAGMMVHDVWYQYKDKWYYLGTDGAMLTGQQTIDGKWYVLNEDGAMVTDPVTLTPDQDGALTWPGLKE